MPLAHALGGNRETIAAGVSLGIEPAIDDLLVQAGRYAAEGYPRIKPKIAPGRDGEPVRAVRDAHPDLDLHVAANGAYTEDQYEVFAALDRFGLTMIEQPFAPGALVARARLQARVQTDVCLDESVDDLDQLDTAMELGAGRVFFFFVFWLG